MSRVQSLASGQHTVALNAPTSAVGRAALQMCRHRGIAAVAFLRPRDAPAAFEADRIELLGLGATAVLADDGKSHRAPEGRAALATLPPVALALNGVGGGDSGLWTSRVLHRGTRSCRSFITGSWPWRVLVFLKLDQIGNWIFYFGPIWTKLAI